MGTMRRFPYVVTPSSWAGSRVTFASKMNSILGSAKGVCAVIFLVMMKEKKSRRVVDNFILLLFLVKILRGYPFNCTQIVYSYPSFFETCPIIRGSIQLSIFLMSSSLFNKFILGKVTNSCI
jgi:hypothetical protein